MLHEDAPFEIDDFPLDFLPDRRAWVFLNAYYSVDEF
jgi:hypothetical protein